MKIAEKFGRLLARLWPFWLPLFILFALPLTRPFGRVVSDDIVDALVEMVAGESPGYGMPAAASHPVDFDLLIWERLNDRRENLDYSYSETDNSNYDELVKLRARFPAQPLLVAPLLQHEFGLSSSEEPYYDYRMPQTDEEHRLRLRNCAQAGIKLEPDNAFWWASLAHAQRLLNRYDLSLQALERAAKCARYDDHTLELARRVVGARNRYGEPMFFEKLGLVEDARGGMPDAQNAIVVAWSVHARALRARGDNARALRFAGALIRIGDLMQRDPNAFATMRAGAMWQKEGYDLARGAKVGGDPIKNARAFAAFARAQGRADLAQMAPPLAARSQRVQKLLNRGSGRYSEMVWLQSGDLHLWVSLLDGLPFFAVGDLIYLGLWWLAGNLFLWRAAAAPSSRRERVGLGLATMLPMMALGAWGIWALVAFESVQSSSSGAFAGSMLAFGFAGVPFVIALCCALTALRRHRARFQLPPRIDTEMALASWTRAFLRWFLPVCVAFSIAFLLINWATWLVATARGWGTVDVLALLPPDRSNFTGSLLWDSTGPVMLSYAVALCVICLLIWFGRWRWTTPLAVRPLTQSALRWWKEALGIAIVVTSWLGLLMALGSVPFTREADARLERFINVGELKIAAERSN